MSNDNLKNIVVLKNLPSNLIDEAIVILKSKKTARKLELIEKSSVSRYKRNNNSKDYVVKEAENVVANYIANLEKNKNKKNVYNNMETKYKKIKAYSIFISILLFFCMVRIIF